MVRIAISQAAFEALAKTLPFGDVGYENKVNEKGERLIWLEPSVVDRLRSLRGPGESYSDVILRAGWGDTAMSDDKIDVNALFSWTKLLTPEGRQLNVVSLCCSFMRNLGFHSAGMQPEVQRNLLTPTHQGAFWREAHANFIDICVLDWCKLFVDRTKGKRRKGRKGEQDWGEHHWRRVVNEPDRFGEDLCTTLGVTAAQFDDLIAKVKDYRNTFVAHRDEDRMAHLPMLELPKKAIAFLHERLAREAPSLQDWQCRGLPTTAEQLDFVFTQAFQEAQSVYADALAGHSSGASG
jgi:hypothetical protein